MSNGRCITSFHRVSSRPKYMSILIYSAYESGDVTGHGYVDMHINLISAGFFLAATGWWQASLRTWKAHLYIDSTRSIAAIGFYLRKPAVGVSRHTHTHTHNQLNDVTILTKFNYEVRWNEAWERNAGAFSECGCVCAKEFPNALNEKAYCKLENWLAFHTRDWI